MLGLSYGEIFLIIGATAALIGPKDLPIIARTAGRLAGRAIGYVQLARGQFDNVMQHTQFRQVNKELQDTMAQLEAIRGFSIMNPGPLTQTLPDGPNQANANAGVAIKDGPSHPSEKSIGVGKHKDQPQENQQNLSGFKAETSVFKVFHGQPMPSPMPVVPHQPSVRPRVRARRGQATDPHSIAERLRRERIAERIRALQELVPSVIKTDRAAMLDEVVDYVKFLRLQVKVLSMSRLGGAGAVVPLVTDMPISSVEEEGGGEGGQGQPIWEKWSNDGTEKQVAKLMEENVGSAMQFLQSKALCVMPISLASAIYHTHPPDTSSLVKPESNPPP